MKRLWSLLALFTLPFALLRSWDVLYNIDARTGFFYSSGWLRHILILLTVLSITLYSFVLARRTPLTDHGTGSSPLIALLGLFSAAVITWGSALQIVGSLQVGGFRALFMSRRALFGMGLTSIHFQSAFWSGVFGLAAALWFVWLAWSYLCRNGAVTTMPVLCVLPVLWYLVRAFSDFSYAPINYNNTLVFSCLFADLLLALGWYRFLYCSIQGFPTDVLAKASPYALLAFLFTLSFKLPVLLIPYVHHTQADRLLIAADGLSAFTLFLVMTQTWKGAVSAE